MERLQTDPQFKDLNAAAPEMLEYFNGYKDIVAAKLKTSAGLACPSEHEFIKADRVTKPWFEARKAEIKEFLDHWDETGTPEQKP